MDYVLVHSDHIPFKCNQSTTEINECDAVPFVEEDSYITGLIDTGYRIIGLNGVPLEPDQAHEKLQLLRKERAEIALVQLPPHWRLAYDHNNKKVTEISWRFNLKIFNAVRFTI